MKNANTSSLLAVIKRTFNAKIYKEALGIFNAQGRDATVEYLRLYINDTGIAQLLADVDAETVKRTYERSRCFRHLIR